MNAKKLAQAAEKGDIEELRGLLMGQKETGMIDELSNGMTALMWAAYKGHTECARALLEAGGDFADGVIAFEGNVLGGAEFLSFDQQAVKLLKTQKRKARLLAI